jgi:catechol 2,3-dioxygenase-like lactoylglutathione lyase family enzyme
MPTVRYRVNDVDPSLPFYKTLGFKQADRWGPPFAIVKRRSLHVRLSGPGTSARRKLKDGSSPEPGGWNRPLLEAKDIDATVAELSALGAKFRSRPIKGPGGKQAFV